MIKLFYGPKGSGKTKKIIGSANDALDICTGSIAYITDVAEHSKDVKNEIRFFDVKDFGGKFSEDKFTGYICGIIASNSDIKRVYIDGLCRITRAAEELEEFIIGLEKISKDNGFDLYLSVSCDKLPAFFKKYADK